MYSRSLVKCVVQPTSHSWIIERRDPDTSSPKMCAWVALVGSSGIFRLHVCVDCMVALFGNNNVIPVLVRFKLTMGIELKKNC